MMNTDEIKYFLDEKASFYEARWFIDEDPVQIPHLFSRKEDIEIAGFLTATLAWGKRNMILKACRNLMERLDMSPYEFLMQASDDELNVADGFVYRTFNSIDATYFLKALSRIYRLEGGLQQVFSYGYGQGGIEKALVYFRQVFMSFQPPERTNKHVANVLKNSSAKRLNMYLRWMVRTNSQVDFGLWDNIEMSDLLIPLDLHVARVARVTGLLQRKQNDFMAVKELTSRLSEFRPDDPIFYDYALFGLGIYENF
ncbi:TIGR02757 family protein [Marinilabilia sp.]|uniref:TIGR02757 family protein n=1 Tax=Marinilabilia sp. TaxID=2021252 RepID=UPI0025C34E50|nr:TIGR02757 family protein [Marinilabilia sp.]